MSARQPEEVALPAAPAPPAPPPLPLLPYLRLVRAPAVFSALGDPLAGMLIAGGGGAGRAAGVAAGAASIYLSGMALNDLADREEDARERSDRPIPSGAVSPGRAAAIGGGLMAAGVASMRASGAGWAGSSLAGMVLAYNFALKGTAAGPAAMGACRALSMLAGAEAAGGARGVRRAAGSALTLGAYVAGLTLLARGETAAEGSGTVSSGVLLGAAALAAAGASGGRRALPWAAAAAALAGAPAARAVREPTPKHVGQAVGAAIRAIPALDAALAARRAPVRAALMAIPLLALVRWGRRLIPIS